MSATKIGHSRVEMNIHLQQKGRQVGDLRIKWSNNHNPVGYYLTPIVCFYHGEGPTLLITGGVHGDEFEGPAALMRLVNDLAVNQIQGRVIILPALNASAIEKSSRVSPLDHINMNRAFPGDKDGSPTQIIAHFVESQLLPHCDAAIDLHSGGKAAVFATCVLADVEGECDRTRKNLELARAFAPPFLWIAGPNNDNRSLNAAAARQRIPMIAAELGGGGGCDPGQTAFAERAIGRCMSYLGMLPPQSAPAKSIGSAVKVRDTVTASATGLFDRMINTGDTIEQNQIIGRLHFIHEPQRSSIPIKSMSAGIVLAVTNRGVVERGEMLAIIAEHCDIEGLSH